MKLYSETLRVCFIYQSKYVYAFETDGDIKLTTKSKYIDILPHQMRSPIDLYIGDMKLPYIYSYIFINVCLGYPSILIDF